MLRVGEKQGVELALRKAEHEDEEGRSRATSNRNSSSEEMAIRLTRGDNLPAAESISSMDSFEQSASKPVRSSSIALRGARSGYEPGSDCALIPAQETSETCMKPCYADTVVSTIGSSCLPTH
jgi:hypothetical protein